MKKNSSDVSKQKKPSKGFFSKLWKVSFYENNTIKIYITLYLYYKNKNKIN